MSSTTNNVQWTPQLLEQFATEWLNNEILLPDPCYTIGMSQYRVKKRQSAAWRAMLAKLGLPQYRPLQKEFLKRYRRMLTQTASRVRARRTEELLRAAPPWVRGFDKHFRIAEKVMMERLAVSKDELLANVLRAMWAATRGAGAGAGGDVWAGAVRAAAEQCDYPRQLVDTIWRKARPLALTKLRLLQRVGDRSMSRRSPNELTPSEWIAVDLALLYDHTEQLITEETLHDSAQTSTLTALFSLVQHCELDEWPLAPTSDPLMHERWQRAVHAYNYSGRSCSMVVLQRRWLELVHMTRALLAARRTAPPAAPGRAPATPGRAPATPGRAPARARAVRPICTQLAKRFPSLLTGRVPTWGELVRTGRVYTQDHTAPSPALPLPPPTFSLDDYGEDSSIDDDIVLIENDIETIDLADLDSDDETDKLIINERLKMENEQQKVLDKRRRDICDNLDNELDSTLKDIIEQNNGNERGTSSVDRSSFNNKSLDVKNEPQKSANVEIDLAEKSLDGLAPSGKVGADSLQTEIDIVNDGSEQGNLKHETANLTQETANKSPVMAYTHCGKGNLNPEMIESVLKELNATTSPQKNTISLFDQLDPSTMEAKIIFSDDDDDVDCNVNESQGHADVSIQESVKDIDTNNEQDGLYDENNYIKMKEHDFTFNEPARDVNTNKQQKDSIINLDTDDSNSDIEIKKELIVKKYIGPKSFMEMSNKNKPGSPNKEHEKTNQELVVTKQKTIEKKRIGPKSFMEMCNNSKPNSPNAEHVGSKQVISGKKLIGPKSFMESLNYRNSLESEKNDTSVIGSVKTTQNNAPETQPVSSIVSDKPSIISDQNSKNVMEVSCKNELSSDDEDSVLVIAEQDDEHVQKEHSENINHKRISSKLCFDEDVYNYSKNDDIDSKRAIRENILNKYELDKTTDTSKSIKSEPDRSIEKTKTTETFQCKLSFEPDDLQISKINNDTEPAAMEVADPVVNTDTDKNTNKASTSVHESENSKDSNDHSLAKSMSPADDTEVNAVANEESDALSTCNSENDDAAISHLDQLVMTARIPLYRIDELSVWKRRAKDGTIDVILRKGDGLAGKEPSKRLKPGLRPSGWAGAGAGEIRLRADRQSTGGQQGRDFNPVVRLTRLPKQVLHGYLVKQKRWSPYTDADAEAGGRARKRVELADIEEVRRVNRQLRTAQVKPTPTPTAQASASEQASTAPHEPHESHERRVASAEDEAPVAADTAADNTLTPEELDEVLKKLKPPPAPARPPAAGGAPSPLYKYCCLARRHLNYNRARARLAVRAGKQCQDKELHNVTEEHAELRCSCCCLAALKAETQCSARLAAEQRALDAALRQLAPRHKVSDPALKAETQCSARLAAEQRALDAALRQLAPRHKVSDPALKAETQCSARLAAEQRALDAALRQLAPRHKVSDPALKAETQCSARLAAEQRALDAALRQLAPRHKVSDPALKAETQCSARLAAEQRALDAALRQLAPRHKSGSSAACAAAAAASTTPRLFLLLTSPQAEESDDDLPLIQQKLAKEKASLLNKPTAKKRNRHEERKKRKRKKKEEEEEAVKEREINEYDEYMRQKNMFAKYFTINPSSSTRSSRPQHSVTVRPRLPDKTPQHDAKENTLTKEMIDLHEQSLDPNNATTREQAVIQCNKMLNIETPNVNALPDLQASAMSIDLTEMSKQNQSGTVIELDKNNITSDHDCVEEPLLVAIEPGKDVQNIPAPVIIPSPPVRIVPGMYMMKPVTPEPTDPSASVGTEKSQNQPNNYKDIHKISNIPSLAITNSMGMARWPMAKNIKIVPFEDQKQSAQEPKNYINFPQPIKLPTIQQSNSLESSETTSQPNQQINKPKIVTANQPQKPTGLKQPDLFKSPETTNQPKQQIQQPEIATVNLGQPPTSEQQPITQTAKEFIYVTEPTNDPKKQKVTKVSGMCSDETVKLWNYSENKVLLKTLIDSSQANPGSKLMRELCSPKLNETVLAICQSNPENCNQCSVQIITQPTNTLVINPNLSIQSSIRVDQDKMLLQNTAGTNFPNIQVNVNVFPTQAIFLQSDNNVPCKINTKQGTELVENVVDNSTNKFMNENSKDEDNQHSENHRMPVIANVESLADKNMPSSNGGTQVDATASGLGSMSKLNPNQSPVPSTPESDPDATPFVCDLTKNTDELTDSPLIGVDHLVKFLNENDLFPKGVQILGKEDHQDTLKLLDRYILINEIQDNASRRSRTTMSYWTLKPRLDLSQILFTNTSRKRKFDCNMTSESGNSIEGKEGGSVEKAKLRVKEFAKMPSEEGGAEEWGQREGREGAMMSGYPGDEVTADGRWFKKLTQRPCVRYAQVLTVVPSAAAAGTLLATDAQLHLLDLRGTSAPWPLRKCSKIEDGKLLIDVYCAHAAAADAMQELQRVLRELKSFSINGEATITCHYTAGSDNEPPHTGDSNSIPPPVIDSNIVPPHTLGFNNVPINTNDSSSVPPHTVLSNNANSHTVGSNNVPPDTVVSNDVPLNTLGSNNVISYTVGPYKVLPHTVVSDNVPLYTIGPNNVPIQTVGSQNVPSYNVGPNNVLPHTVVSNNFPSHLVVSNNVPINNLGPDIASPNVVGSNNVPQVFPHTMVSNSTPTNTFVSNNLLPNVVGLNNDPVNTLSPNNVPPHFVGANNIPLNVVGLNSVPEDSVTSGQVILHVANAGCFSPGVLRTAGNSGGVLNHSTVSQDDVIVLESDDEA